MAKDDDIPDDLSADEKDLQEAKKRFAFCEDFYSYTYGLGEDDYQFGHGDSDNMAQWPDQVLSARELNQKPMLTVNKTRVHCLQIINDAKQNKSGIVVHPTTNEATYEAAEVYEDMVRNIENRSHAEQAYDLANENQVYRGIGYCRVVTEYSDPDGFEQNILLRGIKDPRTVFLDPDAQEKDRSDAEYGFVFDDMSKDKFKREFPDADPNASNSTIGSYDTWVSEDHVRVAEYWKKTHKRVVLVSIIDPQTGERRTAPKKDISLELIKQIRKEPEWDYRERDSDVVKVECIKIAGNSVVDRYDWAGQWIPIVPAIGEEVMVDGRIDFKGHVRYLKDAQRMYNYNTPLALDTPLPTPTGWTTMNDVRLGQFLLSDEGLPVEVVGVSPIHLHRDCYRVEFNDGSHIIADGNHLWTVEDRGKRKSATWDWTTKTVPTIELKPGKQFIWGTSPLDLSAVDLPIDPYVLGVWLGDGSTAEARFSAGIDDAEEMCANVSACGYRVGQIRRYANSAAAEITIHGLRAQLSALGLLGRKHIPDIYQRASTSQRWALLQGLMDTDGSLHKKNHNCIFTNTNPEIVEGFSELLVTLGIQARRDVVKAAVRAFPNGRSYECQEATNFRFTVGPDVTVFRLSRKAVYQSADRKTHPRRTKRHAIVEVVRVPSVPVKCITVASEAHLFLAGTSMIPTHNSAGVEAGALQTKTPWSGPAAAFEGYEEYYAASNVQNLGFLPYKHRDDEGNEIPAPSRVEPPRMSEVFLKGMEISQQEMMMASGQYQSQMGEQENAKSGKAIAERQRQGDNATYHFVDGQATMIRHLGRIIVDLIPKIYDTQRVMRIRGDDGTIKNIVIDPNAQQAAEKREMENRQEVMLIFNPNIGKYGVEVDVGPSFATRRQEAWNAIIQILTQSPDLIPIVGDLLFQNADFPGADEIAIRLRRMAPPQALGDGPPPEDQAMQAHIGQLTQLVAELNQKLASKDAETNIRAFEAETKRLQAIGNAGPIVSKEQAQPLIAQSVSEMTQGGAPEQFGEASAQPGQGQGQQPQMPMTMQAQPPMPVAPVGGV